MCNSNSVWYISIFLHVKLHLGKNVRDLIYLIPHNDKYLIIQFNYLSPILPFPPHRQLKNLDRQCSSRSLLFNFCVTNVLVTKPADMSLLRFLCNIYHKVKTSLSRQISNHWTSRKDSRDLIVNLRDGHCAKSRALSIISSNQHSHSTQPLV